jgi:hypothetical protein
MDRDEHLLKLRPQLNLKIDTSLPEEQFQNQTLRPILKLQHELLLAVFRQHLADKNIAFESMSAFKQRVIIENAVKKDLPVRHTIMGCIIGLLTREEYTTFLQNRIAFGKRATNLIIQRITDELVKPKLENN